MQGISETADLKRLVRGETGGVDHSRAVVAVVIGLVPAQVPAPRLLVVPNEGLVAHAMQRRVAGRHADHGVRAALLRRPGQLEKMKAPLVADPGTDAVCRLGHRVAMEGERVLILYVDVERAVVGVPGVGNHYLARSRRHV